MKRFSGVIIAIILVGLLVGGCFEDAAVKGGEHIATAEANRDSRMEWWREARFGMFIHWGLYAVPAGEWDGVQRGGYSEWLPKMVQVDDWDRLVDQFNPVKFDADAWVKIAKDAGMKYIVITTKHHEGFAMWDSAVSDHDIMATPFKRDVMAELAAACKREGIKLGWYHSVLDWRHPDYLPRREIDKRSAEGADYDRYIDYMKGQLRELLTDYGDIAVLWFDGGWDHGPAEQRATEICDMAYALQPGIIINDRIGLPMDYDTPEQRIPDAASGRDWETCMTITSSWGYNKGARDWKSAKVLVRNLVDIARKGGNYLLNVGPTGEGVIPAQSVSQLREIGSWLAVNGESIYGTDGSIFPTEPDWGRCTVKRMDDGKVRLYLHVFDWPSDGRLELSELGNLPAKVSLLKDASAKCSAKAEGDKIVVEVNASEDMIDDYDTVIVLAFASEPVVYYPPVIEGDAGIFIDEMDVRLDVAGVGLDIRYTLDESEPMAGSAKYDVAIRLTDTAVVKARSFHGSKAVADVVERKFVKVDPSAAAEVGATAKGLRYRYYEGLWEKMPVWNELTMVAEGVIETVDISVRKRQEKCGIVFDAYINVPVDGVYQFALASDDGSNMLIDGETIVDNDGLHARQEKLGVVAMAKGKHAIRVEWFNGTGGAELELQWGIAGGKMRPLDGVDVCYGL